MGTEAAADMATDRRLVPFGGVETCGDTRGKKAKAWPIQRHLTAHRAMGHPKKAPRYFEI